MNKIYLFLVFSLLLFSCNQKKNIRKSGICLSFDDRSVQEWFELRTLFQKYNARATFFITQFDSLNESDINKLRQLKQEGNEIGFHGALHVVSEYYIKENSYHTYLENEIFAGMEAMSKAGLPPSSFAYPYGSKYWFTDFLLLRYFKVLRTVSPLKQGENISELDEIFFNFDGKKSLGSVGMDLGSKLSKEMVRQAIKRAVLNQEVVMLHGHFPSKGPAKEPYQFDIEFLEFILNTADENGLKFYRFSDLIED
ncbi:polysaccharide deacetylase family protein [Xanthovirga aplysinae]|uniref:polysaccharide deacetylase family protein n=1 Tax=Xanthovirga aplysinae TaxID=2529853 RepID=UPI0012BBEFB4|nr:polysaccharide deacetylase family protein [Xanthovirga aplysinae]